MSKDRVENLPFTTYDLIGYLAPGSVLVIALVLSPYISGFQMLRLVIDNDAFLVQVLGLVAIFLTAYIAGHIVSYISSEVSEKFVIRTLGYPVQFMMREKKKNTILDKEWIWGDVKKTIRKSLSPEGTKWWKGNLFTKFIYVFHLNLAPVLFVSKCLGFGFYSEPLSKGVVNECKRRFENTWPHLTHLYDRKSGDWFHLVEHFTFDQYPEVTPKAYNYVVLYGLLRSLFFLSTTATWILPFQHGFNLGVPKIIGFVLIYAFMVLISWILGMAYCKFYRRYTREIISRFAATCPKEIQIQSGA